MAELIRITKVGGRYIAFEVKDVAALRRDHCICAVFVGTTPQNPNQNVFSGLPIELLAEEAKLLVDKGVAYIVDDAVSHLTQLSTIDPTTRHAYLQSLKTQRRIFQRAVDEEKAEQQKLGEQMKAKSLAKRAAAKAAGKQKTPQEAFGDIITEAEPGTTPADGPESPTSEGTLFSSPSLQHIPRSAPDTVSRHITPTTSTGLLADPKAYTVPIETPRAYPLYKHLNSGGYYITPGIRFGADYSVYPGDPFRYHAHFMATSFEWDEEIAVLDLVTGGRLGTGVKKGFLIGGEAPPKQVDGAGDQTQDGVRAFTIEWAAM